MKPKLGQIIASAGILLLSIGLIVFFLRAFRSYQDYRFEISLTPTPVVRRSSVNIVPLTTLHPDHTPEPTPLLLKNGSSGDEVRKIQVKLKELGYMSGEVDGQFGNATKNAVIWFQNQHGLDADGIVGKVTYDLLFSNTAKKAVATPSPSPVPSPSPASSAADEDFLVLVNKKIPLPDNYTPVNLVPMDKALKASFIQLKYKDTYANASAVSALEKMLQAAFDEGIKEWQISSAYRSISDQKKLFNRKKQDFIKQGFSSKKADSATLQTVAMPGTSEHHTGLAFDITVPGKFFKDTKQSKWIAKHCHEYGFVLRYQEGKEKITGYIAEPWHIRYVGLPHSVIMHEKDWTLEQYLESMPSPKNKS